jgi:hypothetical protein
MLRGIGGLYLQTPEIQCLLDAMESTGADFLFGLLFFAALACVVALLLFAGLAVRAAWGWLAGHTWHDAVVSAERRAVR